MKNKFKFLIASVSIAMLFLSSCEKEIYDDAIYKTQQPQNLSISKISFKELKSNKNAVEKIKHVMTKKLPTSIANRAVYNEDFGVLIDTTNIVQMTSATEQSITFNIVDYTNSTKKENLVLISKNDGNFEAYIAEYNLIQQDLDILASGGTLQNIKPTSISEIENASKVAVSGDCVSSYTYSYWACYNSNGDIMANNGELGNGCVGIGFEYEMQVITIDMACLADGGGGGGGTSGTSGTSGTGTSGTGTTGSGPTGGSTNTGSNLPNSNQSILDLFNTTFVPCTSCIEFTETLSDFLEDLTPDQLEYWNDLSPREQQNIVDYLEQPDTDSVFLGELIDLAISNDASFQFDNTIDTSNTLVFNTVQDFENYLETNLATLEETDFEIDAQDQRIATAKLSYGTFGITIKVKQNMLPTYEVVNVSSIKTGLSILLSYEQTDYNVDIVGSYVNVDVYGLATTGIKITVPFEANITFEDEVHFRVVIDKNTGHLITAYEIND